MVWPTEIPRSTSQHAQPRTPCGATRGFPMGRSIQKVLAPFPNIPTQIKQPLRIRREASHRARKIE